MGGEELVSGGLGRAHRNNGTHSRVDLNEPLRWPKVDRLGAWVAVAHRNSSEQVAAEGEQLHLHLRSRLRLGSRNGQSMWKEKGAVESLVRRGGCLLTSKESCESTLDGNKWSLSGAVN